MGRYLKVLKALNIEGNEIVPVILLITQSVFLGVFYGTFDIGAHTMFLKTYPEDMIPKAYIISGIVGVILTSLFSKFQSKIQFSKLANYTLLFISIITVLLRLFFELSNADWTVFLVFILLGPLNILAIVSFWGTVGRIFNLRQGKRLYGIIDSGQVFGIIISSFAIPLILIHLNGTKNLLIISAISIVIAMLIENIIVRRINIDSSNNDQANEEENNTTEEQVKLKGFIKDPYIMYMALFVVFSMFAAFFVQYSFLVVTNEQYPGEDDLAKYLAFFTGSMMMFTFIIKTFVYSKLLKTYGLKASLLLSSLLLALFTGIAIGIGYVSGFELASPGFIYFFLFISMGKLFNKALKDGLEGPSFKLLYQSLKKSIRFDVQAKIDGTINEIAALISGILLSILAVLSFVELIHFSVVLFVLLVIWFFITVKLYKEYRNSLEKTLKLTTDNIDMEENHIIGVFKSLINNPDIFIIKLSQLKTYNPINYLKDLQILIQYCSPKELHFLTKDHLIEVLLLRVKNSLPDNWKRYIDENYKIINYKNLSIKELNTHIKSNILSDVNSAINYISLQNNQEKHNILGALLRTPDIETKKISCRICGTLGETEQINTIVEYIDSQLLFPAAITSLLQFNSKSIVNLIQIFYRTDIPLITQLSLVEIIGKHNTSDSIRFLLENISHVRKEIREKSIVTLKDLGYQPTESELPKLFHPITMISQTVAWDISAIASLDKLNKDHLLIKALNHELNHHQNVLLNLLSITYSPSSVECVQNYLNSGTGEGISYALELFDLFLSEEIKPMILAVYEDLSLIEKTKLFENFFPVKISSLQELLLSIINRNPNLISKETKRLALIEYTSQFNEITNDIIAQLFNPVLDLQLTAAKTVNKISPSKLKELRTRMSPVLYKNLKQIKADTEFSKSLIQFDYLLSESLKISDNSIIELLENIEITEINNSHTENYNELIKDYFVFLIIDQNNNVDLLIDQNYSINNIDFTNNGYILGVKKNKMNKLLLTNNKNLIEGILKK